MAAYSLHELSHASLDAKFTKRLESTAFEFAERAGYLLDPSASFILLKYFPEEFDPSRIVLTDPSVVDAERQEKYLSVLFTDLSSHHLKGVGEIFILQNLRICSLSDNFIISFESLLECKCLEKLDLHHNQIVRLPSKQLWSNLARSLKILLLHDNPISKLSDVPNLAQCSNLVWLTLMDTPISLSPMYRHFVVNTLWSLKALDQHAISDFEIMEEFKAVNRFSPCSANYQIADQFLLDDNYTSARQRMFAQFATINNILRHYSPVLIIQRFCRGHMTRQRLAFQNVKVRLPELRREVPIELRSISMATAHPPPCSPAAESYSALPSPTGSQLQHKQPLGSSFSLTNLQRIDIDSLENTNAIVYAAEQRSKHINEELTKDLQSPTAAQTFLTEATDGEPKQQAEAGASRAEVLQNSWGLFGTKKEVESVDPMTSLLTERFEAGLELRDSKRLLHQLVLDKIAEDTDEQKQLVAERRQFEQQTLHKQQRVHQLVQPVQPLAVLRGVERDQMKRKTQSKATAMKRASVRLHRDTHYHEVAVNKDRAEVQRVRLLEQRLKDVELVDRIRAANSDKERFLLQIYRNKVKSSKEQLQRKQNAVRMAENWCCQQSTISRALQTHDHQLQKAESQKHNMETVTTQREMQFNQHQLVQQYLQHREQKRRTETSLLRSSINTQLVQDATKRVLSAKARVERFHEIRANVRDVIKKLSQDVVTELCVDPEAIQQRWDTLASMYSGHIGHHPPAVSGH